MRWAGRRGAVPARTRPSRALTARALTARALTAIGLVVGLAGALTACSGPSGGSTGTNYVAGDGTITLVPVSRRKSPVELSGTTLEGKPIDVASYRGRVVVLNVWGSWCPPCRKEAPDLQAASQKLAASQVVFLGIDNSDPDPAQALAFQKTFGITYPSLSDSGGQLLLQLQGAVPPNAVPATIVLDTQGRIAARISSATTTTTVTEVVGDVIAGKDTL
jgi:thiol-disulfide isomerase/thioredoxin